MKVLRLLFLALVIFSLSNVALAVRKKQFYSVSFKLKVVAYAEKHGDRAAARVILGDVKLRSNVQNWKKQKVINFQMKFTILFAEIMGSSVHNFPFFPYEMKQLFSFTESVVGANLSVL